MRLIAGEAKGRRLNVPRGLQVRPSGARWRKSAFGILDHRDAISGGRVLDLFAGTGALGLEALSRGAAELVAVEVSSDVAQVLRANLRHCGFADRAEVLVEPALRALERLDARGDRFDLVLIDPPYRQGLVAEVLAELHGRGLVAAGGRLLVEHARDEAVEANAPYDVDTSRRCGDSFLTLLQRTA